jgi:hypothetical protein
VGLVELDSGVQSRQPFQRVDNKSRGVIDKVFVCDTFSLSSLQSSRRSTHEPYCQCMFKSRLAMRKGLIQKDGGMKGMGRMGGICERQATVVVGRPLGTVIGGSILHSGQ